MFGKKDRYEVVFIIVYFIEQIALIILTFFYPNMITLFIPLFPIVFLTTIAIEKACLKSHFQDDIDALNKRYTKGFENAEILKLGDKKWKK